MSFSKFYSTVAPSVIKCCFGLSFTDNHKRASSVTKCCFGLSFTDNQISASSVIKLLWSFIHRQSNKCIKCDKCCFGLSFLDNQIRASSVIKCCFGLSFTDNHIRALFTKLHSAKSEDFLCQDRFQSEHEQLSCIFC